MKHMFGHDTITDSRKKGDLLLIAAVCLAAVLAALFFFGKNSAPAAYAVIELDGREWERLPLPKIRRSAWKGKAAITSYPYRTGKCAFWMRTARMGCACGRGGSVMPDRVSSAFRTA